MDEQHRFAPSAIAYSHKVDAGLNANERRKLCFAPVGPHLEVDRER